MSAGQPTKKTFIDRAYRRPVVTNALCDRQSDGPLGNIVQQLTASRLEPLVYVEKEFKGTQHKQRPATKKCPKSAHALIDQDS